MRASLGQRLDNAIAMPIAPRHRRRCAHAHLIWRLKINSEPPSKPHTFQEFPNSDDPLSRSSVLPVCSCDPSWRAPQHSRTVQQHGSALEIPRLATAACMGRTLCFHSVNPAAPAAAMLQSAGSPILPALRPLDPAWFAEVLDSTMPITQEKWPLWSVWMGAALLAAGAAVLWLLVRRRAGATTHPQRPAAAAK